jgi:hypothetical protein
MLLKGSPCLQEIYCLMSANVQLMSRSVTIEETFPPVPFEEAETQVEWVVERTHLCLVSTQQGGTRSSSWPTRTRQRSNRRRRRWKKDPHHLYKPFLEDKPCWLYYDLEYSTRTNPGMKQHVQPGGFQLHRLLGEGVLGG